MPKYFTIIHSITALVNINTVGNACKRTGIDARQLGVVRL
jgi:hypothetical protein